MARYIRWFEELRLEDVPLVGGKNASLGEMYRELTTQGVRVPNGFAITAQAFRDALTEAGAWDELHGLLDGLDKRDVKHLAEVGARCREIVYAAGLSEAVRDPVLAAHRRLREQYGAELSLAVRSSATAEDLPTASFAGQHDTFLNVRGEAMLLDAIRRCFASLFTDRAISYRIDQGFDHFKVALSVGVMKMVRADLAASGVMFSLDTETGFRDVVFITGAYGLGENVVKGTVDPDEFYVHKPTFRQGHRAVLRRALGPQAGADGLRPWPHARAGDEPPDAEGGPRAVLHQRRRGADARRLRHPHRGSLQRQGRPPGGRWTSSGRRTAWTASSTSSRRGPRRSPRSGAQQPSRPTRCAKDGEVLVSGRAVGTKVATGQVRVIRDAHELPMFKPGEVLVADTTTPDWEPVMKTAAAIVTNRGGRTCHAAIVARELGVPAVVGAEHATERCQRRRRGHCLLRRGRRRHASTRARSRSTSTTDRSQRCSSVPRPHIMVNLGNPDLAFQTSFLPNDGVGLARMEFIISERSRSIRWRWSIPERVEDPAERERDRAPDRGLRPPGRLLRREALRGRRHDRGGLLSEAGDRAHVGFQDQRVCGAARRSARSSPKKPTRCWASAARRATRTRPTRRASRSNARPCERVREDDGAHEPARS